MPNRRGGAWHGTAGRGETVRGLSRQIKARNMGVKRQPKEQWAITRARIWVRDGGRCQGPYCKDAPPLSLDVCHIDHIKSGRLASNADDNLRVLCRRCHVLRADNRHRGMIAKALRDGIIPPNWRELVWED